MRRLASLFVALALAAVGPAHAVPIAWGNAVFPGATHSYTSGSGTETVPVGASLAKVVMWSGGAAGGKDNANEGGGGGGGCQAILSIRVTGGNTMPYVVAASIGGRSTNGIGASGAASSVTGAVLGGTVNLQTSSVATGGSFNLTSGAGAICSGGTTNTTGGSSGSFQGGNGAGVGGGTGGATLGAVGNQPGGGGAGQFTGSSSGAGAGGEVSFVYQ